MNKKSLFRLDFLGEIILIKLNFRILFLVLREYLFSVAVVLRFLI